MKRLSSWILCLSCSAGLAAAQAANSCPAGTRFSDPSATPGWNGWGAAPSNARFQSEKGAQLPADQISKLQLKWAFGFPGVKSVMGAPVVAAGRVFLGVDNGSVYSLDAATGCQYWV